MARSERSELPYVERLLPLFDVDPENRKRLDLGKPTWECYSIRRADGNRPPASVVLILSGPKTLDEAKRVIKEEKCVILFNPKNKLYLRAMSKNIGVTVDSEPEYHRIGAILKAAGITGREFQYVQSMRRAIDSIPKATTGFDNRGVFSNHYLLNRMWADIGRDIESEAEEVRKAVVDGNIKKILKALGWNTQGMSYGKPFKTRETKNVVILSVSRGTNLSMSTKKKSSPSWDAAAALKDSTWVILTNGVEWRLYTTKVSTPTTNHFAVHADAGNLTSIRYLVAMFGSATYEGDRPKIDQFFEEARMKAKKLESDLSKKILSADGLFIDIVKGVLDHDMRKKYSMESLGRAKKAALDIMYRVWFILYAESRDLLPVRDRHYAPISLRTMRANLDDYADDKDGFQCWNGLLKLFVGIRKGSPKHNLPRYNGGLFAAQPAIDDIKIRNRFIVPAMRSLLEEDGEAVDYSDLGVRHLGSIYESLLEFDVRQASQDMIPDETSKRVKELASKEGNTYGYRRNDLYLTSKSGIISRKTTGSFYTPDEIVSFLVRRGLEPLLEERSQKVATDVLKYRKKMSEQNRRICVDRLLDLQVLDPAMGSGHFLVEALRQITLWVTEVLSAHPEHPLVGMIEGDRQAILNAQEDGVTIDERLLTAETLLKRRVMKRCIFGVDLNPLAVELTRLSLWLDSFAVGAPLTYLDHHIMPGDSTIGLRMDNTDMAGDQSLDDFMGDPTAYGEALSKVSSIPDLTIEQVTKSQNGYVNYKKQTHQARLALDIMTAAIIDPAIHPKTKRKTNMANYARRLICSPRGDDEADYVLSRTADLAEKYSFFHWDISMMDAFTDARRGFDLIVGNPPWEKAYPYSDEFFTRYDPAFSTIKPNTKKAKREEELLTDPEIREQYDTYKESFKEKTAFYKTYQIQGRGHKDMWQIVFERILNLVTDGGMISVLLPSPVLSNMGATAMRGKILDMDIAQAYVFENRRKIFPIHSSYRFLLLTLRNKNSEQDTFPAAFYLHNISALQDPLIEQNKFTTCSKHTIKHISPNSLEIPEVSASAYTILENLSHHRVLGDRDEDGWEIKVGAAMNVTTDAALFRVDGVGWPVMEGSNIHQFNSRFSPPDFTADKHAGLSKLRKKKMYRQKCDEFYEHYMIMFRRVTSATNTRTVIATIAPPHRFSAHSIGLLILTRYQRVAFDAEYDKKISYLTGVLNSTTFDFVARSKIQMDLPTLIARMPVPNPSQYDNEIANISAQLTCGMDDIDNEATDGIFASFGNSLGVVPRRLSPAERIDLTARLDALVAHAYGLTHQEYEEILSSFKFNEDESLYEAHDVNWSDNKVLKKFYGEVRRAALPIFTELSNAGNNNEGGIQ